MVTTRKFDGENTIVRQFKRESMMVIYRICHDFSFIKRVLKNVIKRAFGELNNIFQDSFNKTLSQKSTSVRFFLSDN